MSDHPKDKKIMTSEALMDYLRERVNDIDHVVIPVQVVTRVRAPNRSSEVWSNVGALIKLTSGEFAAISCDDAEMLINDGVLQKMKIKCKLDSLESE